MNKKISENNKYLNKQILTYLGNKRLLLRDIESQIINIKKQLNKDKLICLDLFSGSGIVARLLKQYSSKLIVNDLEEYSKTINECYLANSNEFNISKYNEYLTKINSSMDKELITGIISNFYSPKDDTNISPGERTFYTNENAKRIDSYRKYIDDIVEDDYKKFFLAPLLIESSIHANTSGVFKGFYKDKNTGIGIFGGTEQNALKRIKGKIILSQPVLSDFNCEYLIYNDDANSLVNKLDEVDVAYLDPPYNQHPYGSNYFMLNVILKNEISKDISKVSGIPENWKRSNYNKKQQASKFLKELIKDLKAKYIIISYSSEGFISFEEMKKILDVYGTYEIEEINYYVFRGCKNLSERNTMLKEYLFILHKSPGEIK